MELVQLSNWLDESLIKMTILSEDPDALNMVTYERHKVVTKGKLDEKYVKELAPLPNDES